MSFDISALVLEVSSRNVNHEPTASFCLLNNCKKTQKKPKQKNQEDVRNIRLNVWELKWQDGA